MSRASNFEVGGATGATSGVTSDLSAQISINIAHELDVDFQAEDVRHIHVLEPSARRTIIEVTSSVASGGAQALRSPKYLAVQRRRFCAVALEAMAQLSAMADRPDFASCTVVVADHLERAVKELGIGTSEGNAIEVMRLIRDTFWDGGFIDYRRSDARAAAINILSELRSVDHVAPESVPQAHATLRSAGLRILHADAFIGFTDDEDTEEV